MKKCFEIPDIEAVTIISEAITGDIVDASIGGLEGGGIAPAN